MKVIYSKYNRGRLPKFQIETSIYNDHGRLFVTKKALTADALSHIKTLNNNYIKISENYKNIKIVKPSLKDNIITFEFIKGNSLDSLILESLLYKDKQKLFELFEYYKNLINQMEGEVIENFCSSSTSAEVFGLDIKLENVICISPTNIDLIFDNIIINEEKNNFIIDYEWVFDFYIPVKFIIYRSVYYLILKYPEYLKGFIREEELFSFFEISDNEKNVFYKMESNFQKYVFGTETRYEISYKYLKELYSFEKFEEETKEQIIILNKKVLENLELNETLNQLIKEKENIIQQNKAMLKHNEDLINEKHKLIQIQEDKIQIQENKIQKQEETIQEKEIEINQNSKIIQELINSNSWKITKPIRKGKEFFKKLIK